MLDPYRVRRDFPILSKKVHGKQLVYFDNAATSQRPLQVVEAVESFYKSLNANIGRSVHELGLRATEAYEDSRKIVAAFIGAKPEELVFTKNTTESINLAAYSLLVSGLISRGDAIVVTRMEHHSNLLPWVRVAKLAGAELRVVDVDDEGRLRLDEYEKALSRGAKIVAVTHVSNVTGVVNPVKELCRLAHDAGAFCLVDGAQSTPHMRVDVKDIGADFFAFSGHKMLGPMGTGGLYIRGDLAERLEPPFPGGGAISLVSCAEDSCSAEWLHPPHKFEAGTPNVAGAVGLAKAVEYLRSVGMEDVEEHEKRLTAKLLEVLEGVGARIYGPRDMKDRLGVVSFNLDGLTPHEVASMLDLEGIAVRSGHHCALPLVKRLGSPMGTVRASLYLYNTPEEVEYFGAVLEKIKKLATG
ncbi:aminotransferase class V-fold PLP-dependent enzyme [Thermofilum pendens]|uniref:cysteine desulfurase n=1 Tax=Thermofilum pendens (strain DSM 2475 / Hrk 5) TaxID=368408 RepID=A1RYR9_THEPD|nr:SufS family cysteine desulfurase [Thermofilum pendens]ABL78349.1 cysteine desulfurase, SufS subfamily [Thermofilum pendens Hrk 5]